MNNITDFEIVNGVLVKYKGTDPNVIIPNGVTEIGENAFYNCEFITSVTIPKGVTKIGARAFCNCKSLVSATIPNGVTSIGESAFSQCSSLTSITIPNGVISIGKHAFSHCSSLTRATIPDRVTSIGEWAFYYCSSLISVTIPNSVTSIGRGAFCDCSSLTSIEVDPQNSSYRSIDGNLYSKDGKTLIQYAIGKSEKIFAIPNSVTSIGEYAFSHCSSLTSVTIPNGVTSIGWGAFSGCYSLTSIIIPDSVTSIGECAFSDCRYLKNITIPDSVISIGEVAFFGCSSLTSIEVDPQNSSYKSTDGNLYSKDGKTLIQYAIGKSEKIFAIPNSVTSIGGSAFSYCFSLTSVTIPNSVTEIGNHAFRSCTSLTSVTIPNSVASIESWAFYGCKSLTINCEAEKKPIGWNENWNSDNRPVNWGYNPTKIASDFEIVNGVLIKYKGTAPNVIIPNSVTSIESWAFSHCSSLTSVTIPNSVTKIGAFAFDDCILLARIDVAGGNTVYKSIEGNLYSKDGETLIRYAQGKTDSKFEIPNSVKSIEDYAFFDCSSLASIIIPNGVTSIGEEAFSCCSSLTSVTIPNSVSTIEGYAFYECKSLAINCEAEKKPDGWSEDWNPSKRPVNWGYKPGEQEKKGEDEKKYKEVGNVKPSPIENFKITSNGALTKYLGAEETITIPEGVKSISTFAFTENYEAQNTVKHIILPKSLEVIEDGAFADLAVLEQIVIPKGVKAIGRVAFRGCESLTIYCEVNEPPKGWDTRKYSLWSAERPVVWGYKSK